jgi:hypothetical protein
VPVGATVNTTNPNSFAVNVTPTNSVSNATVTSVSVNNTQVATTGGVTVLVPAGGTIKCTYAAGTTTYNLTAGNGRHPGGDGGQGLDAGGCTRRDRGGQRGTTFGAKPWGRHELGG